MAVMGEFFDLAANAERIYSETLDISKVEPEFEKVLTLIQAHPECHVEFVDGFIEILKDAKKGPSELVSFCVHELRWNDLRSRLLEWMKTERSERVRPVLRDVLEAFEDDWRDADMFRHFSAE